MEPKIYTTLAQLKAAYDSGELHRDWGLTLDHHCSFVYVANGADPREGIRPGDDALREKGEVVCVYDGPGTYNGPHYEDREGEMLEMLGIPWRRTGITWAEGEED